MTIMLSLCAGFAPARQARAQSAAGYPNWPGKGQLFVGAWYQPIDRSPVQIEHDIAIMKKASFTMVRMGDLSWDSFEPSQRQFEFAWSDKILAQMHAAGTKIVVDIAGLPAPMWLHQKFPGVDIVSQDGVRFHPAPRYSDNISDPDYQRIALQLPVKMLERYAHNPAVVVAGYDNGTLEPPGHGVALFQ